MKAWHELTDEQRAWVLANLEGTADDFAACAPPDTALAHVAEAFRSAAAHLQGAVTREALQRVVAPYTGRPNDAATREALRRDVERFLVYGRSNFEGSGLDDLQRVELARKLVAPLLDRLLEPNVREQLQALAADCDVDLDDAVEDCG